MHSSLAKIPGTQGHRPAIWSQLSDISVSDFGFGP